MLHSNFSINTWVAAATVIASAIVGVVMYAAWVRRAARKRRAIPDEWPLNPRLLANTEERRVWNWLRKVFYNHHIMVKIPITRFTLPRDPQEGQHWYNLLGGVYCTLTVCAQDGRVVGCVDLLGRQGLSRNNRKLKRSLLTQCGIAYLVIEPGSILGTAQIRTVLLGEAAALNYASESERDEAKIAVARLKLSEVLERQRRIRNGHPKSANAHPPDAADSQFSGESGFGASNEFDSEWQKNSFMAPLDSRRGDLSA